MSLGQHLSKLRLRAALSQAQVADIMGVSRFTVSSWETDRNPMQSASLVAYLDAVGATPEERLRALELAGAQHAAPADGAA